MHTVLCSAGKKAFLGAMTLLLLLLLLVKLFCKVTFLVPLS